MTELNGNGNRPTFFLTQKAICDHFGLGAADWKLLYSMGMPVVRINKRRYFAYRKNIEAWLQIITAEQKEIDLDESELPEP